MGVEAYADDLIGVFAFFEVSEVVVPCVGYVALGVAVFQGAVEDDEPHGWGSLSGAGLRGGSRRAGRGLASEESFESLVESARPAGGVLGGGCGCRGGGRVVCGVGGVRTGGGAFWVPGL